MNYTDIDKDSDDTIIEHLILEKKGILKGHHFLPKKKKKEQKESRAWLYLLIFYIIIIPIIYLQKYNVKVDTPNFIESSATKIMHIYDFPNNSLYSFCKTTGIKESEIRELNPWIDKQASNILASSEILVPIH